MKKFIFVVLASLCLSSCDNSVSQGREVYKAYLKHTLKDPESLKIYNEQYTQIGDTRVDWKVDYGAKNSYGGMVRETLECTTIGTNIHPKGDRFHRLEELK